jgi:ketosteroid isomerase-like protein
VAAAGDNEPAMSEENVAISVGSFAHFNREGYLPESAFDPEVEFSNLRESPLPGPYHGYDGLRQWRDDIREVLDDFHFEVEGAIDVDESSAVVIRVRLKGSARHTGIPVDYPFTVVNWMRNAKTFRSEAFLDHQEALDAVGLSGSA